MFTGIIQSLGDIRGIEARASDAGLLIGLGKLSASEIEIGDSVAVNGVCLTAVRVEQDLFAADVSSETLSCTTLAQASKGMPVNLELALTPSTRMGGHIVSGHVDGIGKIASIRPDGRSMRIEVEMPQALARYVAAKGSICIDGISLTVNSVEKEVFGVNIVPHTLRETTLGQASENQTVNLEVDLLARYLERLVTVSSPIHDQLDLDTLKKAGFF